MKVILCFLYVSHFAKKQNKRGIDRRYSLPYKSQKFKSLNIGHLYQYPKRPKGNNFGVEEGPLHLVNKYMVTFP